MTDARRSLRWVLVLLSLRGVAFGADRDETPELDAQRDAVIEKLLRGEDFDRNVERFSKLLEERDAVVPTSRRAFERQRREQAERAAWRKQWRGSFDEALATYCSVTHPPLPRTTNRLGKLQADWGRVTRKEVVTVKGRRPHDEDKSWTLYEVEGQARRIRFAAERANRVYKPFQAEVGDRVMFCAEGSRGGEDLPASWHDDFVETCIASKISSLPRITTKGAFTPRSLSETDLFWAFKDGRWPMAPGEYALVALEIDRPLGENRYEFLLYPNLRASVVIPPSVRKSIPVAPGQTVWAIVKEPVLDERDKRWVLTAVDLETDYVEEVEMVGGPEPASRRRR